MLPLSLSLFLSLYDALSFHSLTLTLALTCTLTHSHADSRFLLPLFFSVGVTRQRGATIDVSSTIRIGDRDSRSSRSTKQLSFVEMVALYPFRETSTRRFFKYATPDGERRNRKQKTRSAIFSRRPSRRSFDHRSSRDLTIFFRSR